MRYKSARKVWHDCYMMSGRSISGIGHMDPTARALNEHSRKASTTIHATETRSRRPGGLTDPESYESFELVRAHQIIKAMPDHLRAWGMFAYTTVYTKTHHRSVQNHVYKWWCGRANDEFSMRFVPTMRHLKLVEVAIEDMRQRLSNGRPATTAEMARLMDVEYRHWHRDWAPRLEQIENFIDDMDRRALAPISKMLSERQEEEANEPG